MAPPSHRILLRFLRHLLIGTGVVIIATLSHWMYLRYVYNFDLELKAHVADFEVVDDGRVLFSCFALNSVPDSAIRFEQVLVTCSTDGPENVDSTIRQFHCVGISKSGSILAYQSDLGVVVVESSQIGGPNKRIGQDCLPVDLQKLIWSIDESLLLLVGRHALHIWSLESEAIQNRIKSRDMTDVFIGNRSDSLLIASQDGEATWSLKLEQPNKSLMLPLDTSKSLLDVSRDFQFASYLLVENAVHWHVLWDIKMNKTKWKRRMHFADRASVAQAFSIDGTLIACAGTEANGVSMVRVLDVESGRTIHEKAFADSTFRKTRFDARGRLWLCTRNGFLTCWDFKNDQMHTYQLLWKRDGRRKSYQLRRESIP